MNRLRTWVLFGAIFWSSSALAAETSTSTFAAERRLGSGVERVITTADQPVQAEFTIWKDESLSSFIKPIVQMSSSVVGYLPQPQREGQEFNNRVSTLLLARIGFEGELFGFVSFRSLFERNFGFSLVRNGPVGTSIWEGTASWQARENYIRLSRWGFSLTGGIVPDPASVDFVSDNILDSFGMDPYVRDPLLLTGFNQGQSVLLRYSRWGLTAGVGFTGGNPLVTSLSFGFGGSINQTGSIFTAPLRAITGGFPATDIHLNILTPSLTYENDLIEVRTAAQLYWVDLDVTNPETVELTGYNLRASTKIKLAGEFIELYGSASFRENDQVENFPSFDVTEVQDERFLGVVGAGGFDVDFDKLGLVNLGFGGNYYYVYQRLTDDFQGTGEPNDFTFHYINLGLTYWLWEDVVSTGFRWARSMSDATQEDSRPTLETTDSFILSLRLII